MTGSSAGLGGQTTTGSLHEIHPLHQRVQTPQLLQQPVQRIQTGARPFPLENGGLLSEGENFEGGIAATTEKDSDGGED